MSGDRRGRRELVVPTALSLIVILAGVLRFYGLAWGAPYFHFHIDEHFVFVGAERLRVSMEAAAQSAKFFMYGPVPMRLLNAVVWPYERVAAPLNLTVFTDQVTYMEKPSFYFDYVMWGARRERHDYYAMYTLDTYAYL